MCNLQKIINNADMEKFQKGLDRLGEWAVDNAIKMNPSKNKGNSLHES